MQLIHIFIKNTNLLINYILINYRIFFFISIIIFLFFVDSIYVTFAQTTLDNTTNLPKDKPPKTSSVEDEYWFPIVKDVIVPLIIGIIGMVSARLIVNRWQEKKDISSIRSKVLSDFQESFKDYIVMMDTFVAKILLNCYIVDSSKSIIKSGIKPSTGNKLTDLLPYGYDIGTARNKTDNLIFQFSEFVKNRNKICTEFDSFEKEFFNRRVLITKFSSGLRQYYKNGDELNKKFDALWETKIMYGHILIQIMINSQNEKDFIRLLNEFNSTLETAFKGVKCYDYILSKEEIAIERDKEYTPTECNKVLKDMDTL